MIRTADIVRIVGPFLLQANVRPFDMQAQRLIPVFVQVGLHHGDATLHHLIATGDQRRQITGAAGALVGALHDLQRLLANGLLGVVKLHAATAIELDIDKAGGQDGAAQIARGDVWRQSGLRTDFFN